MRTRKYHEGGAWMRVGAPAPMQSHAGTPAWGGNWGGAKKEGWRARRKGAFRQRAVPWRADAMNSVAARSFGASASVIRPTSPYLNAPPLAHSTTTAMACFLVVATRRATVRNSLRSWLNPKALADPLPLLCAASEVVLFAGGLADPFPPAEAVPFPDEEGCAAGFGAFAEGVASLTRVGSAISAGGCGSPFARG